jgi:hypothetical protein
MKQIVIFLILILLAISFGCYSGVDDSTYYKWARDDKDTKWCERMDDTSLSQQCITEINSQINSQSNTQIPQTNQQAQQVTEVCESKTGTEKTNCMNAWINSNKSGLINALNEVPVMGVGGFYYAAEITKLTPSENILEISYTDPSGNFSKQDVGLGMFNILKESISYFKLKRAPLDFYDIKITVTTTNGGYEFTRVTSARDFVEVANYNIGMDDWVEEITTGSGNLEVPVVKSGEDLDASKVRSATLTIKNVPVTLANLYPIVINVENTGDVSINPDFFVEVYNSKGETECSGSPLFDDFEEINSGDSQSGEITIMGCMFTEDGTYKLEMTLHDSDYSELDKKEKSFSVNYWSQFQIG